MEPATPKTSISVMLAAVDTPKAVDWYEKALGARLLWSLGSVAGLEVDGAPFFLHEPVKTHFQSPQAIGATTARVELFVDQPDEVIARAVKAGATGGDIQDYVVPWGDASTGRIHRSVRAQLAGRGQVSAESVSWLVLRRTSVIYENATQFVSGITYIAKDCGCNFS